MGCKFLKSGQGHPSFDLMYISHNQLKLTQPDLLKYTSKSFEFISINKKLLMNFKSAVFQRYTFLEQHLYTHPQSKKRSIKKLKPEVII